MVGVAGGGVGFWPDTKRGGGGGCCRFLADTNSGGGGGGMVAYRGEPGYSTVAEFMRAGINRQRNRAAITCIIKCGPKSYEFINGRGGGGGGHVPRVPPPPDPPLNSSSPSSTRCCSWYDCSSVFEGWGECPLAV